MFYHCSYDDIDVEEAIDLIRMLPPYGSRWRAVNGDVDATWTEARHLTADLIDALWQIAGARVGLKSDEVFQTVRPHDVVSRMQSHQKAKAVSKKIRETNWEDV